MQHRALYVILGALTGYLLFGSFAAFGLAAVVFNLLTPLPAAYNGLRFRGNAGWWTAAGTALLVLGLDSGAAMVLYLVQFGLPAGVLAWLLVRGQAWDRAVFVALSSMLAAGLVSLVAYSTAQGVSPLVTAAAVIDREIAQAATVMEQAFTGSELPEAERQQIEQALGRMADFMRDVYPGLVIAVSMYLLLGQVFLLSLLGGRGRHYTLPGLPFQQWKAPDLLIWPLILAGFALFLTEGPVRIAAANILTLVVPVYFLQGLAIIDSFFRRKQFSPVIRTVGYLLVLLVNPLPLLVACLGVFDLWVDFRKPRMPKSS